MNQFSRMLDAASIRLDRMRGREVVHFLHIGKTGGTAVKFSLRRARTRRFRILLHRHHVSLRDVPAGDKCFFFVRDPVARMVSGFNSRQREGRPRHYSPWRPDEALAFREFESANDLGRALSDENEERRSAAVRAMNVIHHVRDSFWRWLVDEEYLRQRRGDVLFVGSQEHLSTDFIRLAAMLDLGGLELPESPDSANKDPSRREDALDDVAVRNLRDWYRRDYACLDLLSEWFPELRRGSP